MEERVQGFYKDGVVTLERELAVNNVPVMVVFYPQAEKEPRKKMPLEEALRILDKYAGSIDADNFDYERAKDEYFNEKYGPFD